MSPTAFASLADLTLNLYSDFPWLSSFVETAIGWVELVIILAYSFLIASALPGMSEIALVAPLDFGLSHSAELAVIILVGGAGEAAGSVFTFHVGRQMRGSDYIEWVLEWLPADVMDWTERKAVQIIQNWDFVRLAVALYVPGFPGTLSIYTFSTLEDDCLRFAVVTFVGVYGRLAVIVIGIEAAPTFLWLGWGTSPRASRTHRVLPKCLNNLYTRPVPVPV